MARQLSGTPSFNVNQTEMLNQMRHPVDIVKKTLQKIAYHLCPHTDALRSLSEPKRRPGERRPRVEKLYANFLDKMR